MIWHPEHYILHHPLLFSSILHLLCCHSASRIMKIISNKVEQTTIFTFPCCSVISLSRSSSQEQHPQNFEIKEENIHFWMTGWSIILAHNNKDRNHFRTRMKITVLGLCGGGGDIPCQFKSASAQGRCSCDP